MFLEVIFHNKNKCLLMSNNAYRNLKMLRIYKLINAAETIIEIIDDFIQLYYNLHPI